MNFKICILSFMIFGWKIKTVQLSDTGDKLTPASLNGSKNDSGSLMIDFKPNITTTLLSTPSTPSSPSTPSTPIKPSMPSSPSTPSTPIKPSTPIEPSMPSTNMTPKTTQFSSTTTPIKSSVSPSTTTGKMITSYAPSTTPVTEFQRQFDGPSFIGGIVLTVGLIAIGFIGVKFYLAGRAEKNYRTL